MQQKKLFANRLTSESNKPRFQQGFLKAVQKKVESNKPRGLLNDEKIFFCCFLNDSTKIVGICSAAIFFCTPLTKHGGYSSAAHILCRSESMSTLRFPAMCCVSRRRAAPPRKTRALRSRANALHAHVCYRDAFWRHHRHTF